MIPADSCAAMNAGGSAGCGSIADFIMPDPVVMSLFGGACAAVAAAKRQLDQRTASACALLF